MHASCALWRHGDDNLFSWAPPLPPPLAGSTRISPPASDFDFDGPSLVDTALNRYTQRKATRGFTDRQLIEQEQLEQESPASSDGSRGSGSVFSPDGPGGPDRSYGDLLRSYTQRSTQASAGSGPQDGPGVGTEGRSGKGGKEDLSLAVHLNYEVMRSVCAV